MGKNGKRKQNDGIGPVIWYKTELRNGRLVIMRNINSNFLGGTHKSYGSQMWHSICDEREAKSLKVYDSDRNRDIAIEREEYLLF